jgi:DUF917 family protein
MYSKGLSQEDLRNIVRGATLLASGGGGPYSVGMQLVDNFTSASSYYPGDTLPVVTVDKLEKGKKAIVAAVIGAPEQTKLIQYPDLVVDAVERVQKLLKVRIDYIVPVEVGALSSPIACMAAAKLGIPVVDVDGAGRAVPTLNLLTYAADGITVNPTVLSGKTQTVDGKGYDYHYIALNISDDTGEGASSKIEALARPVLSLPEYGQMAGLAIWYMEDASVLKNKQDACVPDTLLLCKTLGEYIKEEQKKETPDIKELMQLLKKQNCSSKILAEGTLEGIETVTAGGFDHGIIHMQNNDKAKTKTQIILQNESLLVWNSAQSEPLVMAPDSISYVIVKPKSGGGEIKQQWVYSNADITGDDGNLASDFVGAKIYVIGIKARKQLLQSEKRAGALHVRVGQGAKNGSVLPAHYMSVLNSLGYYGVYKPLAIKSS